MKASEIKRRQKDENQNARERFAQMMRGGCHDCRRVASHAMQIQDGAKPPRMVAVCPTCALKRVTADIVTGIAEDRPHEPEGVFSKP